LQKRRSSLVGKQAECVCIAIDLDNKSGRLANEISEIWAQPLLAAKFEATKTAST